MRFSAWTRTRNLEYAKQVAAAKAAVVGFCVLDGFYYVVSADDFAAGPFVAA
jgi:hypothetical protein